MIYVRCSYASLSAIDSASTLFSSPSSSDSKQRARQLGQLAFTVNQLSKHWGSPRREALEGGCREGGAVREDVGGSREASAKVSASAPGP